MQVVERPSSKVPFGSSIISIGPFRQIGSRVRERRQSDARFIISLVYLRAHAREYHHLASKWKKRKEQFFADVKTPIGSYFRARAPANAGNRATCVTSSLSLVSDLPLRDTQSETMMDHRIAHAAPLGNGRRRSFLVLNSKTTPGERFGMPPPPLPFTLTQGT